MVFARYDAKLLFIKKRSKKLKINKLLLEIDAACASTNVIQGLLDCCKKICDLNMTELLKEFNGIDNAQDLAITLQAKAEKHDPNNEYETIWHAVLLLKRAMETHGECQTALHETRAAGLRKLHNVRLNMVTT